MTYSELGLSNIHEWLDQPDLTIVRMQVEMFSCYLICYHIHKTVANDILK